MFHPSYKSINLTAKQLGAANEWITTKDRSVFDLLINYQVQASPFSSTFFSNVATKFSLINWRKALRSYGVPIDILELAVKMLRQHQLIKYFPILEKFTLKCAMKCETVQ